MLLLGAILLAVFVVPEPWGLLLVGAAAIFEIGETYLLIRLSRRRRIQAGPETMIGARAEALADLRPEGQVRVGGEIWQARCEAGAVRGAPLRVTALDGLTLVVEPEG